MERIDNLYRLLASMKLALYLFIGLVIILVPKTLISGENRFINWAMVSILGLLLINLCLCTYLRFSKLRKATLLIHIGTMVTLAGGMLSQMGYVATINIHEGSSTDTVYRWDTEQDMPLGFDMRVHQIKREYYPIPVKVGVLVNGQKDELNILKTGESFQWGEYSILVHSLDPGDQTALLEIYDGNEKLVGTYDTSGESSLPPEFPLTFQLVAFKDPVLKNMGAELLFSDGDITLTTGYAGVNAPFVWNGLRFHITNIAADQQGLPYIGLQVVKDPGVYSVYAGFLIIMSGCLLHLRKSLFKLPATEKE